MPGQRCYALAPLSWNAPGQWVPGVVRLVCEGFYLIELDRGPMVLRGPGLCQLL